MGKDSQFVGITKFCKNKVSSGRKMLKKKSSSSNKARSRPKNQPPKRPKAEDTFNDEGEARASKMLGLKCSREVVAGKKTSAQSKEQKSREVGTKNEKKKAGSKKGSKKVSKQTSTKKVGSRKVVKKLESTENSRQSAEKTDPKEAITPKVITAIKAFCNYLLDMKESSANAYFDAHLAKYAPTGETTSAWEKNMSKNRSKEHKLYDSSRVKLTPPESTRGSLHMYINASLVKFDNTDTEFIMTQFPLQDGVLDFWHMVHQKGVDRLITIYEPCVDEAIEEFSKIPSTPTTPVTPTPNSEGGASQIGPPPQQTKSQLQIMIERSSRKCDMEDIKSLHPLFADNYMNLKGWLINCRKVEPDHRNKNWLCTYTIEVLPEGCSDANFVRVFNCCTWPWKKYPTDEPALLALVRAPWKDIIPKLGKPEPILVMCDLGLDRSATVVLTTILLEMIFAGKPPDCDALFRKMRDQRAGCFTMSIFYTYALRATLFYIRIRLKSLSSPNEEVLKKVEDAMSKVPFVRQKK